MLRKPLCVLLTALSLAACETAASNAERFVGAPLVDYSKQDQAAAAAKIQTACGDPPACPGSAILERMALDYGKLRAMIRAIGAAQK